MDKFSDDLRSAPPGTYKPTTVAALLRRLKLADADRNAQAAGIRGWLAKNTPSELMVHSLRINGYQELLDPRRSAT